MYLELTTADYSQDLASLRSSGLETTLKSKELEFYHLTKCMQSEYSEGRNNCQEDWKEVSRVQRTEKSKAAMETGDTMPTRENSFQ